MAKCPTQARVCLYQGVKHMLCRLITYFYMEQQMVLRGIQVGMQQDLVYQKESAVSALYMVQGSWAWYPFNKEVAQEKPSL